MASPCSASTPRPAGVGSGRVRRRGRAGPRAGIGRAVQAGARLRHRDRRPADPCAWPARCRRSSGRRRKRPSSPISRAPPMRRREEHHAADRADQSARPAGLFPHPRRAGGRHHRQGRAAEREHPVRLLSRADRRRRSDPALREASAAGRPRADRGGAVAPRARRGRGELSGDLRGARSARLRRLGRLRIPAARQHRGRLGLGPAYGVRRGIVARPETAWPQFHVETRTHRRLALRSSRASDRR